MPFARPTLSELRTSVAADIASALPGADALLPFSNLGILGNAEAGLGHLHYGYIDWIAKQAVPYTATGEYLEAWAGLKNVVRKPATKASGNVAFTGTDGSPLNVGTQIVRDDGVAFVSLAASIVSGGTATVTVEALNAGASGNTAASAAMTLAEAVNGVQSTGTVSSPIIGGADAESDDDLRNRMLAAYRAPPEGGAKSDYIRWALSVPGITRAWCVPNGEGDGTVVVYIMLDDAEAAFGGFPQGSDGVAADESRDTPATGDQLTVADYIFPLAPVCALIYVKAPTSHTIAFTISGLSGASSDVTDAVEAAIADVFVRVGEPGATAPLSEIESAIAAIAGTQGFVITTPSANITNATGELPVLGTVTYS